MRDTSRKRYAVVSCHVERPLDGACWERFVALQRRAPGGFRIAALLRPPDVRHGEDEVIWLERAQRAAALGPIGLHTHWTAPDHARPTGGDPGALVREQSHWLADRAVPVTLFCGGGWYTDEGVAHACAEARLTDCTPRPGAPGYLADEDRWAQLAAPSAIELTGGSRLEAIPSTRSLGELCRRVLRPGGLPEDVVHVHFHDTDLVVGSRRRALVTALVALGLRRTAVSLDELVERLRPDLPTVEWADVARGGGPVPVAA